MQSLFVHWKSLKFDFETSLQKISTKRECCILGSFYYIIIFALTPSGLWLQRAHRHQPPRSNPLLQRDERWHSACSRGGQLATQVCLWTLSSLVRLPTFHLCRLSRPALPGYALLGSALSGSNLSAHTSPQDLSHEG